MIIGETVVNPRDILNAWYRFEPGACAYCFTIRSCSSDQELESYTDREQWTQKKEDIDAWMKLVDKCINDSNVWRDEMSDSFPGCEE
jgi:hypothetical protein